MLEVVLLAQYAPQLPFVMSFSYGWPEDALLVWNEIDFINEHLMALGTLGVSVVVSSGDQGARNQVPRRAAVCCTVALAHDNGAVEWPRNAG